VTILVRCLPLTWRITSSLKEGTFMPSTNAERFQEEPGMKRRRYTRKAIYILAGLAVAAMIPLSTWAENEPLKQDDGVFTVDVALDATTLIVNHVDPTQPPLVQLPGDTLVIEGTIYRGGTLPSGIADNDPNAPGGIGKIRCRALVLVPPTDLTTPVATFVTELYSFPDDNQTIIADGPGANLFATVLRAVLGGTRSFDGVSGQLIEKNLGLNKSGACNLRITFRLKKS
jgi:hypothetical protein